LQNWSGVNKPNQIVLLFVASLAWARPARALQPLDEFVRAARAHHPANQEAQATRAAAEHQAGEALGRALPALSAAGSYLRNQWEVSVGTLSLVPRNQVDGIVALTVPLVDLARFTRVGAARHEAEAAAHASRRWPARPRHRWSSSTTSSSPTWPWRTPLARRWRRCSST
jgi:outer membrane protein TolC